MGSGGPPLFSLLHPLSPGLSSYGLRVGQGDRRLTRALWGFWLPAGVPFWAVMAPLADTDFIFKKNPVGSLLGYKVLKGLYPHCIDFLTRGHFFLDLLEPSLSSCSCGIPHILRLTVVWVARPTLVWCVCNVAQV